MYKKYIFPFPPIVATNMAKSIFTSIHPPPLPSFFLYSNKEFLRKGLIKVRTSTEDIAIQKSFN